VVLAIGVIIDQLRGHLQGRALDGLEHHGVATHGPCEAEVADFDDALGAEEDVLGLEVAVDDAV